MDRRPTVPRRRHPIPFPLPAFRVPVGLRATGHLEAMGCEAPVVASAVGGIPEVVVNGETGILVPYDENETRAFEHAFADAVNRMASDSLAAKAMGIRGRARAVEAFGWQAIAKQTVEVYRSAGAR